MIDTLASSGIYIIKTLVGLATYMLLVRFLMQASRANYYNPICQGILRATAILTGPLARVVPSWGRFDGATLVTALLIQTLGICAIMSMAGYGMFAAVYLVWSAVALANSLLSIYFFVLLAYVIMSWIAPYSSQPAAELIRDLAEPICEPARRIIPPLGGLDFSIILVFVGLNLLQNFLLILPLARASGLPTNLVMGL
ncbi:MAG: YggT family protein [Pseudomonadales bacterium]|jgi:YggT family protein